MILNRKVVGKVTEENLVIAPNENWEETLKEDVEGMLQVKEKRHQIVRSEGICRHYNEIERLVLEKDRKIIQFY